MIYKFCPNCGTRNTKPQESFFKCDSCGKKYYANSKPTAAVILIVGKEILMAVRGIEPGKGKYDFVGGFLENGEPAPDGAVREFEEETGYKLKIEKLELLGMSIGEYRLQDELYYTLNITYAIGLDNKPELKATDDVADLVWLDPNSKIDHAFEYQRGVIEEVKKKFNL